MKKSKNPYDSYVAVPLTPPELHALRVLAAQAGYRGVAPLVAAFIRRELLTPNVKLWEPKEAKKS